MAAHTSVIMNDDFQKWCCLNQIWQHDFLHLVNDSNQHVTVCSSGFLHYQNFSCKKSTVVEISRISFQASTQLLFCSIPHACWRRELHVNEKMKDDCDQVGLFLSSDFYESLHALPRLCLWRWHHLGCVSETV